MAKDNYVVFMLNDNCNRRSKIAVMSYLSLEHIVLNYP